ncbi:MAG: response regulator [Spirochaetia bacterium]
MRFLIVDDNIDLAETLADILEINGYNADVAPSGEEAIEMAQNAHYDLIFMDVKLPGKNGVDSFLEIQKHVPECKVVMMTGYKVEQLLEQAMEHGALEVLRKPFETEVLFSVIKSICPNGYILLVEDDVSCADSLKDLLEEQGYQVEIAQTGYDAVQHVVENGAELLILDVRIPELNGLEVYLKLKSLGKLVPTIVITAYAKEESETLTKFKEMEVAGVLAKPFAPEEIIDLIGKTIQETK